MRDQVTLLHPEVTPPDSREAPLSLVLLEAWNVVPVAPEDVADALVQSVFAVVIAHVGARVVYGLGREVARARVRGSYRLDEKLGEGAMGEVWKASHRMLARPAAIKLIRRPPGEGRKSGISGGDEAAIRAGGAGHREPPLAPRRDALRLRDRSRRSLLLRDGAARRARCGRARAAVWASVAGAGRPPAPPGLHSLIEADTRGLVHRDLNPANIFLCRYGAEHDFVKVPDFGLVKTLGADAADAEPKRASMPPAASPRGFSRGSSCSPPTRYMGVLMHHAKTPPTPPSARTDAEIPDALDRLVLSCLAKNPGERPQSARALSDALAGIPFASPWTEDRAREWWARHLPANGGGRS